MKVALIGAILGSLLIALSPSGTAVFLMTGRIIQGLSAACIMPATLALMKAYFDGKERQRALSFRSIGSWGGSGVSALFGGLVASSLGWRWIFWISILIAVVSFLLIRGTPESKVESTQESRFDWYGFAAFIIAMVAVNIVIGQGDTLGWLNPTIIALALVQQGAGLSSLQSGLLTVGYLVAILSTIRVGEKLLQKMGARKSMLMGCAITATGILLTTFTFLLAGQYMIVAFIGFTLFGVGQGFYATPSTDAALSNVPDDKAGAASGIYKMASSLGAAFGVAISAALFTALSEHDTSFTAMSDLFLGRTDNVAIRFAAAVALLFNVLMVIIAIIAIIIIVPRDDRRESVNV
ncbi:MAG TPA: MFS transporter [Pyrinomonadaceae bacterium]|jgi:DHA2 family multidrug resistance protein-like MFS transporter